MFVDINPTNLCMNEEDIIKNINGKTKAVFMSHIQGFNGLSSNLLKFLKKKKLNSLRMCVSRTEQNLKIKN